jgi:hypothetical protein
MGLWKWDEVLPDRLAWLKGSNKVSAYRVAHFMLDWPLSRNVNTFFWLTWTDPGVHLDFTWTLPGVPGCYPDFTWTLPGQVGECKVLMN